MKGPRRFLFGGIGALMPVLVSVVSLDIAGILRNESTFTAPNVLGIAIRYVVLFAIGGVVAFLHTNQRSELQLFELGIAAPALITSLVAANGVQKASLDSLPTFFAVHAAYAGERSDSEAGSPTVHVAQLRDVVDGITGKVYRDGDAKSVGVAKPSAADTTWLPAADGTIPAGAVQAGQEAGPRSEPLYVCRAPFQGGLHPGKVRPEFGGCNIGWGGREYKVARYEVLAKGGRWSQSQGGGIPPGALKAGQERPPGSEDLYVCRAAFHGGVHPGKVRPGFAGCNVGWGGQEHAVATYEVMVR